MAQLIGARRVFELGSGYGYSAYWFLQGMSPEGRVIMTDGSDANRKLAMFHHDRLGTKDRVEFHVGNAVDILRETDGPFDIIFNDIDKEQYPDAYHAAVHKLHPGGLFITDNTLWSGRVADKSNKDEATEGVREFNRLLFADWDLFPVILPIRDGLAVAVKKG